MAGRNQHFIPRFLQRAFGIRPTRKDIWYFGRGEKAEKRSVKRTASEDYFYSEPQGDGRSTLDDAITRMESDLAALLNEIRAKSPGRYHRVPYRCCDCVASGTKDGTCTGDV